MTPDMTPEQEYEEAANRIENFLVDFDIQSGDLDCYTPDDLKQLYKDAARRLLALKHPSGQPVLAVLKQDQTMQIQGAIPAMDAQECMRQIREQGFRRVLQAPSLKQEAK